MSAVSPSATVDPHVIRRDSIDESPAGRGTRAAAESLSKTVEKALTAEQRLALSRMELRTAMMAIAHPPPRPSVLGPGVRGAVDSILDKARDLPGAAIVIESVERWWKDHPLRTAGVVASEASRTLVKPIVERNPQSFLLGAVALGGLFVLTKPWRWLLRPALFMGLLPQLISQALKHVPLETVIRMATASVGSKKVSPFGARQKRTTPVSAPLRH